MKRDLIGLFRSWIAIALVVFSQLSTVAILTWLALSFIELKWIRMQSYSIRVLIVVMMAVSLLFAFIVVKDHEE